MSKGLNTTIALGGAMLALMAVSTGASAQGASEYGNSVAQPAVEWDLGAPDPMAITWPREERARPYRETVEERSETTSATGHASPARKVRSGD